MQVRKRRNRTNHIRASTEILDQIKSDGRPAKEFNLSRNATSSTLSASTYSRNWVPLQLELDDDVIQVTVDDEDTDDDDEDIDDNIDSRILDSGKQKISLRTSSATPHFRKSLARQGSTLFRSASSASVIASTPSSRSSLLSRTSSTSSSAHSLSSTHSMSSLRVPSSPRPKLPLSPRPKLPVRNRRVTKEYVNSRRSMENQANSRRSHHTPDITHAHTKIDDHMNALIMNRTKSHHHNYVKENATRSSTGTNGKQRVHRQSTTKIDDHMNASIMNRTKSHHHNYVEENAIPSSARTTGKQRVHRQSTKIDNHMNASIMNRTKSHHHNYVKENAIPSSARTTGKQRVHRQSTYKTIPPPKDNQPGKNSKHSNSRTTATLDSSSPALPERTHYRHVNYRSAHRNIPRKESQNSNSSSLRSFDSQSSQSSSNSRNSRSSRNSQNSHPPPLVPRRKGRNSGSNPNKKVMSLTPLKDDVDQEEDAFDSNDTFSNDADRIVLSLSMTISTTLHRVVAIMSEKTSTMHPKRLQSLGNRAWGKSLDQNHQGKFQIPNDTQVKKEGIWTEVGRTEIVEEVIGGETTPFLFSMCTTLDRSVIRRNRTSKNERHIAVYHIPSERLDCHPVDEFVPLGYEIVDIGTMMFGSLDNTTRSKDAVAYDVGQCVKILQPFQHLSIVADKPRHHRSKDTMNSMESIDSVDSSNTNAPDSSRRPQSANYKGNELVEQQTLDFFVQTLRGKGIPGIKLPRGKKCIVKISDDRKALVINKQYGTKIKHLSLEDIREVSCVADLNETSLKDLPKKMQTKLQTNDQIKRTCHILIRTQKATRKVVFTRYLIQFETRSACLQFVNGMLLLLKTRSLKITGSIRVDAQTLPMSMMYPDSKKGTYPMLDHVTWTLGASNAIVHEELEESNVALHIPIMLLRDVVLPDLALQIIETETKLERAVSARRQVIMGGASKPSHHGEERDHELQENIEASEDHDREEMGYVHAMKKGLFSLLHRKQSGFSQRSDQIARLEREVNLGKDIEVQMQREIEYMESSGGMNGRTFRASSDKKEHIGRFIPINCHSHRIQHNNGDIDAIVTSGAHCAHSLGFKSGGLLTLIEKHHRTLTPNAPLTVSLFHRLSVCVSQSLCAAITALMFDVVNHKEDTTYFDLLRECGYLCHFECLLSTAGDENGMLDDHIVAIDALSRITVELYHTKYRKNENANTHTAPPRITSIEGKLTEKMIIQIDIGCDLATNGTGNHLNNPFSFNIFPVLISQGINEQQTIANAVGNAGRQIDINEKGISRLKQ